MKNQVIRIIFDDPISKTKVDAIANTLILNFGKIAAIEVYEEEFTDEENENGKEQRQGTE